MDNYTVSVELIFGYSRGDETALSELSYRRFELRDFMRNYFAKKYYAD
jgi:flagellar basal body-associated protein FliL